ncbi:MAG: MBL fold metallo-hydrolase [Rhodothermales bacterium]|nr:MBL fold metallo-hydrolase [Rhodothermales bacterium]
MYRIIVLSLCLLGISLDAGAQVESCDVTLTYIANEGTLIESSGTKILIDGLHREYRRDYSFLPDSLENRLENGVPPFDGIAVVLVSHVHRDHFEAAAVARFLDKNDQAVLISSPQVIDSVRAAGSTAPMETISLTSTESVALTPHGILTTGVLPHSSARFRWIQNIGHRIDFDSISVLHVGDADINRRNFVESGLVNDPVDVAILPYWYLISGDGRRLIDETIRPGRLIAAHVSPADVEEVRREVAQHYPDATVFGEMLGTTVVIEQKCPDE